MRAIDLALSVALLGSASACSSEPLQAIGLAPDTLAQQMLAHWTFDDGAGALVHDSSGNARDAQLTGGTWLTDGRFGGALHLGSGEFASVQRFPDATSSFTVSAWVRTATFKQTPKDMGQWTTIVSTEDAGGWEVNVDHLAAQVGLHFGFWKGPLINDYVGESCLGAQLNEWAMVTGVMDVTTSTYTVYLQGVPCSVNPTPYKIRPGSATLTIGEWPRGGRFLEGDVDDIAIWGRALVPSEILALLGTSPPSVSASAQ